MIKRGAARDFDGDSSASGNEGDSGAFEMRETLTNGSCGGTPLSGLQTFTFSSGNILTVDIVSGNGLTCITAQEMGTAHLLVPGPHFESNFFHLTGNASNFNVNLTLPDSSVNPKICKYPGDLGGYGWDCTGTQNVNVGSVTRLGVTSFSDWAVANNPDPTTLALQEFSANSGGTGGITAVFMTISLALGALWLRLRGKKGG